MPHPLAPLAFAALLLTAANAPALGYPLPYLRAMTGDSVGLMQELNLDERDRTLASESQTALLADAAAVPGTHVAWSNPQSGNSGMIVLIKTFDYDGLPCRGMEHRIKQKGMADPLNFRIAKCLTADGAWKTL